jgi:hypothetical protein
MSNVLFGIAIVGVVWGIVSVIAMVSYISKRGHKISILFIRLLMFKYVHQYSVITRQENGKSGGWFYSFIVSMNFALVCVIIGALLK